MEKNQTASTENTESTDKPVVEKITFAQLNLEPKLLKSLENCGFTNPTEVQAQSIPHLLEGKDITAQAKTGSGKTLAFGLPAIHKIREQGSTGVLVLVPTRELAQQVAAEFVRFGGRDVQATCIIGRESYEKQIRDVNRGAKAVIATPGRLLDLLKSGKLKNFQPDTVVLDEADEMLNMGFIDDIKEVFSFMPEDRQTVFFSATFPDQILKLAQKQQKDPVQVALHKGHKERANDSIEQIFYVINHREREEAILRLINFEQPDKAIIFCRTKRDTELLLSRLLKEDIKAKVLHGDLSQADRTNTIKQLKSGIIKILVATDVASRGIDIDNLSHVFNYEVPENYDRYVHRIGRTGRAGNTGRALTLTTANEWKSHFCLKKVDKKQVKLSEIPSSSSLKEALSEKFMNSLVDTTVTEDARTFCKRILESGDSFELFCKLYSLTSYSSKQELGPVKIGLNEKEISSFLSRLKREGSFSSRSYGSRSYGSRSYGNRSGSGRGGNWRGGGSSSQGGGYQGRSRSGGSSNGSRFAPRNRKSS